MLSLFSNSVSSLITYTGLNYATRQLDILNLLSMSTDECHEFDAVNKLNERASALWDNFVTETFIEEDWQ